MVHSFGHITNSIFTASYSLGCWRMGPERSLYPSMEGQYSTLSDDYHTRIGSLSKCAAVATSQGLHVFAVTDDGKCLGGGNFQNTFNTNGPSTACEDNGEGSALSLNAYTFIRG